MLEGLIYLFVIGRGLVNQKYNEAFRGVYFLRIRENTFSQISNASSNLKVSPNNLLSGVAFIFILFYFLLHEWSAKKSVEGQRKKGRRTA